MRPCVFLLPLLLAALPACGDGTSSTDAGVDARTILGETGTVMDDASGPDALVELPDAQLLDRDGSLVDRDGGFLDRDGGLLDRDAAVCAAMDARGEGDCDLALGIVWNGTACISISGCSCVGTECGELFRTDAACRLRYAPCLAMGGTFACGPMRMCSLDAEYCAIANIGPAVRYTCEPLPASCVGDVSCAACFPTPGMGFCTGDATTGLTVDDGRG